MGSDLEFVTFLNPVSLILSHNYKIQSIIKWDKKSVGFSGHTYPMGKLIPMCVPRSSYKKHVCPLLSLTTTRDRHVFWIVEIIFAGFNGLWMIRDFVKCGEMGLATLESVLIIQFKYFFSLT